MNEQTNPLLASIKIPGETFTLPSAGLFYDENENVIAPDVQNGEITVHPMTAIDELNLRSPDKLFSGVGVVEVIRHCAPTVLRPEMLLIKDLDFLLACIRKVSYGSQMEVGWIHDCQEAESHVYKVDIAKHIASSKKINPMEMESKFKLTLKETGQTVKFRPPRFKDMIVLLQAMDGARDKVNQQKDDSERIQKQLVAGISSTIKDVDGIEDTNLIDEWILALPISAVTKISNHIEEFSDWGPDFNEEVVCQDCKKKMTITAPVNPTAFFT